MEVVSACWSNPPPPSSSPTSAWPFGSKFYGGNRHTKNIPGINNTKLPFKPITTSSGLSKTSRRTFKKKQRQKKTPKPVACLVLAEQDNENTDEHKDSQYRRATSLAVM